MESKASSKNSKLNTFLKIFLCIDLVAIICLGIAIIIKNINGAPTDPAPTNPADELVYEWQDRSIPGGEYKVNLNYATGHIQVIETRFCSAVDCPPTTVEYTGDLTKDELEKIKTITKGDYDVDLLTSALKSLAKDGVYKTKSDLEEENREIYWLELYAEYDLNGDDVVTNQEFGNKFLDYIIEDRSQN